VIRPRQVSHVAALQGDVDLSRGRGRPQLIEEFVAQVHAREVMPTRGQFHGVAPGAARDVEDPGVRLLDGRFDEARFLQRLRLRPKHPPALVEHAREEWFPPGFAHLHGGMAADLRRFPAETSRICAK